MRHRFCLQCVFAVSPLLLPGADAADSFPDYPFPPRVGEPRVAEKAGLKVAAHPVVDPNEQKTYFGVNLSAKGYLPVLVVIWNESSAGSFVLRKGEIASVVNDGRPGSSASATPVVHARTGEGLVMTDFVVSTGLAVGSVMAGAGRAAGNPIPLGEFGLSLISKTSEVRQNLLKTELQSKTLSPGETTRGFLFIPMPRKQTAPKVQVQIPVTALPSQELLYFYLVIQTAPGR